MWSLEQPPPTSFVHVICSCPLSGAHRAKLEVVFYFKVFCKNYFCKVKHWTLRLERNRICKFRAILYYLKCLDSLEYSWLFFSVSDYEFHEENEHIEKTKSEEDENLISLVVENDFSNDLEISEIINKENEYACDKCNKYFSRKKYLYLHKYCAHGKDSVSYGKNTKNWYRNQNTHFCEICALKLFDQNLGSS